MLTGLDTLAFRHVFMPRQASEVYQCTLGPIPVDRREQHALWWAESALAIWLCPVEGCYGKKGERGRGRKNSRRPLHLTFTALLSLKPMDVHSITAHDGCTQSSLQPDCTLK